MALSIIIVSWNTRTLLKRCLTSIFKNPPKGRFEIWVVDNGSVDGSSQMVKQNFSRVHLIQNKKNLGFAKANNLAAKKAKGEYILFLNSDTKVMGDSLNQLTKCLQTGVIAVGPKLINPNGSTQHLGFYRKLPSITQALLFYTDLYRISIKNKFLVKKFWESDVDKAEMHQVDQIPGAALLIRRKTLKEVGYFDEDYPFWLEDVDLCFKIRDLGKLIYCPQSEIIHIGGGSLDKWQDRASKEARFWSSLIIFFDKNKLLLDRFLIRVIIHGSLWFKAISRLIMQIFSPNKDRGRFIKLVLEIERRLLFNQITLPK
jgi:GT2 family glycosyltransferase